MMQLKRYENPKLFLKRVEEFLLGEEVVNNLALGLLYTLTGPSWSHIKIDDSFIPRSGVAHLSQRLLNEGYIFFSLNIVNVILKQIKPITLALLIKEGYRHSTYYNVRYLHYHLFYKYLLDRYQVLFLVPLL